MTRVFAFPGQGSQKVGMGERLFERFPEEVAIADAILGYSIKDLCLTNEGGRLDRTEYTQPALYVVNALHFLAKMEDGEEAPDYVIGHSLGEYNALFAAGAFDFATGLRLVQQRGALMAKARGGGMAAVIGLVEEEVRAELDTAGFDMVDIGNLNTPTQLVISGPVDDVARAAEHLMSATDAHVVTLRVSGAFHSRYMSDASREFRGFLDTFELSSLSTPVYSNAFARPYDRNAIQATLAAQIDSPVRWTETIQHFLAMDGDVEFIEVGPGRTLSGMIRQVKTQTAALARQAHYDAHPPTNSMVPGPVESGILPIVNEEDLAAKPANDTKVA